MGEYAVRKTDNVEVKIGTCESMYYLRYEDRCKVKQLPNNLNPAKEQDLFWRLPFPDEDMIRIGEYQPYNRTERLYDTKERLDFSDPSTADNMGILQVHHESGLLINITCYHGELLPTGNENFKTFWNGKTWSLGLAFIKNTPAGIFPIVQCRFCGEMWRYSWQEILPYVMDEELRRRLEVYNV